MEELTESARQCLVSQGIVLGGLSIFISLGLSVIGILVVTKDNDILHFTSLFQLAVLETVCGLGSLIAVLYVWWIISGYRNRQLIVRSKYLDEKMSKGLIILIFPIVLTFAALIVGAIFLMIKTESSSTYELKSAMSLYATDYTRKIIIDKLQSTLKCCGSQAMEDWFTVDWQNSDVLSEHHCEKNNRSTSKLKLTDEKSYVCYIDKNSVKFLRSQKFARGLSIRTENPVFQSDWDSVPFSCCCIEAPPPCIHHGLQALGTESLYLTGCAEKLDEAVFIFVLLAVILFFASTALMALILYSARKLQTSARSAICKGDATAPGVWWLLTPPGYCNRGKSNSDCLPLLARTCGDSQTPSKCPNAQVECKSKIKKIVTTPGLFFEKSTSFKSDEESSDEWPGRHCEASHSTSHSSFVTTTVANNAILASRQSVSDTAVPHVDKSHDCEHKPRTLYRT